MKKRIITVLLSVVMAMTMLNGCGSDTADSKRNEDVSADNKDTDDEVEDDEDSSKYDLEDLQDKTVESKAGVTFGSQKDAYYAFIGMGSVSDLKAIVDDGVSLSYNDFDAEYTGKKFSVRELADTLEKMQPYEGSAAPVVYFNFMQVKDNLLLTLKFSGMDIYSQNDDSYTVLILNYTNNELHITDSYSSWARQEASLLTSGYLATSGSAGAGESIFDGSFINENGKIERMFIKDQCIGSWMMGIGDTDADLYIEAYQDDAEDTNMYISEYVIGEEKVYLTESYGEITKSDKAYLDALTDAGLGFVTQDEVNEMIEKEAKKLGHDSYEMEMSRVLWSKVEESKNPILPLVSSSDCTEWNYADYFGQELEADSSIKSKMNKAKSVKFDLEKLPDIKIDEDKADAREITFIQSEKGFDYYITSYNEGLIATPDGGVILTKHSLCDFIWCTIPEMTVDDFDKDGEEELVLTNTIFHGTGFSQESLVIVDKDYSWDAYHLTPEAYIGVAVDNGFKVVDKGDDLDFCYEGKVNSVSKDGDNTEMTVYMDSLVVMDVEDASFNIKVTPVVYSENNYMGLYADEINIKLEYKGWGVWE